MKPYLLKTAITMVGIIIICTAAITNREGSPGGYTGSIGDGKSCTKCHVGTAQFAINWITSDIPSDGYLRGETYQIKLTPEITSTTIVGFEITAESENYEKAGSFSTTDKTSTQLLSQHSITHTTSGAIVSGGSKEWKMNWTAPDTSMGEVTFHAAFNLSDGSGSTSGDNIFLGSLTVHENDTNSSSFIKKQPLETFLITDPFTNSLFIKTKQSAPISLKFYSIEGHLAHKTTVTRQGEKIDTSPLSPGLYIIIFHIKGERHTFKYIKL